MTGADTVAMTITDGVARITIAADWLWPLAAVVWLGLYTVWTTIGHGFADAARDARAAWSRARLTRGAR
jgi:hypothetical protein